MELTNAGKSVIELAAELDIDADLIYTWRRAAKSGKIGSASSKAAGAGTEADELARLRRENSNLRIENDILKKAAVILGTENPKNSAR